MKSRWPIFAILCLASLLVPGIASASTAAGAETRVGAFDLAEQARVGVERSLTQELHRGCEPTYDELASDSLLAGRGGRHTPDQRALKELIDEATLFGKKPLSRADAETVLDWADEVKYPGARAKPNDVTGNHPGTKWDGKPHIHIPGAGKGGHVPVLPGVRPR